jgi:hypothetical protein
LKKPPILRGIHKIESLLSQEFRTPEKQSANNKSVTEITFVLSSDFASQNAETVANGKTLTLWLRLKRRFSKIFR